MKLTSLSLSVLSLFAFAVVLPAAAGTVSQRTLAQGRKTFEQSCAGCHGTRGEGAFGPSLHRKLKHGNERNQIVQVITQGIPRTAMPPSKFPAATLNTLVDYVVSMSK